MRHFLTSGCLLGATLAIAASGFIPQRVPMADQTSRIQAKNSGFAPTVEKKAPGVTELKTERIKRIRTDRKSTIAASIQRSRVASRAALPEGYVLFESFEDWDGADVHWTPDGWTVEMNGDVNRDESWTPSSKDYYSPAPADGRFYYAINYSTDRQDEWLISPYVEVADGMDLSYWLWFTPAYLFNLDNVDWDSMTFIGAPMPAANLQVYVQEEGKDWVLLRDYFEEYKDYNLEDLLEIYPTTMEEHNIGLSDYYGKTLRVGFRYYGTDGNTMFIDAIGIGLPNLSEVSYLNPFETLYWGFDRTPGLCALQAGIAFYPVFAPLTWTNMSEYDNVDYTWTYVNPETFEKEVSTDPDELTVTYQPDYSTPQTCKNNFIEPPVLEATSEFSSPGRYQAPYLYMQAGGRPEITFNDGTDFEVSLLPFNLYELELGITTVNDDAIGDMTIPVFGYNANTDRYWLNYSLGDSEDVEEMEGDYSHLIGIANLLMPSREAPLVVNGVSVYGYGLMDDDVELTATIYGVGADMSSDFESLTKIASVSVKGSDIIVDEKGKIGYMCIPFDFEAPVVIRATDEHPAYFVMLEGFNSEKVSYFAPIQSKLPDPNYLCWGYILNHIDLSNHTGRPAYYSLKPMVYKEDGDYVDPYASFAIGLNAEYPWLTTDCEKLTLTDDGEVSVAELGSYYDGSQLTVEAPEGVVANVSGRYNGCKLSAHLESTSVTEDFTGEIIVKGPGVELSIPFDCTVSGIHTVSDAKEDGKLIYDLSGRKVNSPSESGVYIVKQSNGETRKLIIK